VYVSRSVFKFRVQGCAITAHAPAGPFNAWNSTCGAQAKNSFPLGTLSAQGFVRRRRTRYPHSRSYQAPTQTRGAKSDPQCSRPRRVGLSLRDEVAPVRAPRGFARRPRVGRSRQRTPQVQRAHFLLSCRELTGKPNLNCITVRQSAVRCTLIATLQFALLWRHRMQGRPLHNMV